MAYDPRALSPQRPQQQTQNPAAPFQQSASNHNLGPTNAVTPQQRTPAQPQAPQAPAAPAPGQPTTIAGTPEATPILNFAPDPNAGLNMMQPGAAEKFFADNADRYTQPGRAETFFDNNVGSFTQPGMGERFAEGALAKGAPQFGPNMLGTYFDRAVEKSTDSLNDQLAARGAYGSSVGLGQLSEATTDLRAQEARESADFDLRATGEQRAWLDALNNIALGGQDAAARRIATGSEAATLADRSGLDRLTEGRIAAGEAQGAQRQRGQDFFQNNFDVGRELSDTAGAAYSDMFTSDQALLDAILALDIGQGTQGVANATRSDAQSRDDLERLVDSLGNLGSAVKSNPKGFGR